MTTTATMTQGDHPYSPLSTTQELVGSPVPESAYASPSQAVPSVSPTQLLSAGSLPQTASGRVVQDANKMLMAGYVTKVKKGWKMTMPRFFRLDKQSLTYFSSSGRPGEPKQKWIGWIANSAIDEIKRTPDGFSFIGRIVNVAKAAQKRNQFFDLTCETPELCDKWVEMLKMAKENRVPIDYAGLGADTEALLKSTSPQANRKIKEVEAKHAVAQEAAQLLTNALQQTQENLRTSQTIVDESGMSISQAVERARAWEAACLERDRDNIQLEEIVRQLRTQNSDLAQQRDKLAMQSLSTNANGVHDNGSSMDSEELARSRADAERSRSRVAELEQQLREREVQIVDAMEAAAQSDRQCQVERERARDEIARVQEEAYRYATTKLDPTPPEALEDVGAALRRQGIYFMTIVDAAEC